MRCKISFRSEYTLFAKKTNIPNFKAARGAVKLFNSEFERCLLYALQDHRPLHVMWGYVYCVSQNTGVQVYLLISTGWETHVHRKTEQDRRKNRHTQPTNPSPDESAIWHETYPREHNRIPPLVESSRMEKIASKRPSEVKEAH